MKKLTILISAALCAAMSACSVPTQNDYRVIPLPNQIVMGQGEGFKLDDGTVIVCHDNDSAMLRNAAFLAEYIDNAVGVDAKVSDSKGKGRYIMLKKGDISDNKEAYNITVNSDSVVITGASDAGVFYGIQTLRKSLPATKGDVMLLPVEINDAPRFGYRGAMLDVSRHFFPADSVKRFIDMLALHNINRLHWHITDDQGWRIEIKKYPELTKIGSQRAQSVVGRNTDEYDGKPHGGFYTQQEARDIVKYAADRHITVIPEIDLP
ncbi:MAG: family 20 glycosylhydrolase, partial [Rikenellaceae bacterium]|nr:family 20 glycosylhydrolase [Rikenellaceae bacterium]